MPTTSSDHPARPLSRRTALGGAALAAGTALLVAACDDSPEPPGGGQPGGKGRNQPTTAALDPAVAAAVSTITGHLTQLSARYAAVIKRHPALASKLAFATKNHATQLAKLKAMNAPAPSATTAPKPPGIPATPAAAIKDLATREQALAVAHATTAAGLTGEPARLIASIAAGETQLALALGPLAAQPKAKADR
ncbi:cell division protein FtsK [Kribbella deserti]|uniref:Cell division protein FtsK n=1 Tax=Kribbella deserti TaxID=1926257 RepID=A0ABV6QXB9_9ACTN